MNAILLIIWCNYRSVIGYDLTKTFSKRSFGLCRELFSFQIFDRQQANHFGMFIWVPPTHRSALSLMPVRFSRLLSNLRFAFFNRLCQHLLSTHISPMIIVSVCVWRLKVSLFQSVFFVFLSLRRECVCENVKVGERRKLTINDCLFHYAVHLSNEWANTSPTTTTNIHNYLHHLLLPPPPLLPLPPPHFLCWTPPSLQPQTVTLLQDFPSFQVHSRPTWQTSMNSGDDKTANKTQFRQLGWHLAIHTWWCVVLMEHHVVYNIYRDGNIARILTAEAVGYGWRWCSCFVHDQSVNSQN